MVGPHFGADVSQNGRLDEGASTRGTAAAGDDRGALVDGIGDLSREGGDGSVRSEWAQLRLRIGGVTQPQRPEALSEAGDDLVVELVEDDDALRGRATLSGVTQPRLGGVIDSAFHPTASFEIEDDERVAAAKFENTLLQMTASDLCDRRPGPLAACQRHTLHYMMGDDAFD